MIGAFKRRNSRNDEFEREQRRLYSLSSDKKVARAVDSLILEKNNALTKSRGIFFVLAKIIA